nr:hypothetical protein [Glaciibacter flavus]
MADVAADRVEDARERRDIRVVERLEEPLGHGGEVGAAGVAHRRAAGIRDDDERSATVPVVGAAADVAARLEPSQLVREATGLPLDGLGKARRPDAGVLASEMQQDRVVALGKARLLGEVAADGAPGIRVHLQEPLPGVQLRWAQATRDS